MARWRTAPATWPMPTRRWGRRFAPLAPRWSAAAHPSPPPDGAFRQTRQGLLRAMPGCPGGAGGRGWLLRLECAAPCPLAVAADGPSARGTCGRLPPPRCCRRPWRRTGEYLHARTAQSPPRPASFPTCRPAAAVGSRRRSLASARARHRRPRRWTHFSRAPTSGQHTPFRCLPGERRLRCL